MPNRDAAHTLAVRHACQTCAVGERIVPDADHPVGDRYAGDR